MNKKRNFSSFKKKKNEQLNSSTNINNFLQEKKWNFLLFSSKFY